MMPPDFAETVINHFYGAAPELKRILLLHSCQVRDKALAIADGMPHIAMDRMLLINGSMLHDIGIIACHAPGICCYGSADYLA